MKNLLPQVKKYFKANLHTHTNLSDGSHSPEEVKTFYKNAGYSIVAYSDGVVLLEKKGRYGFLETATGQWIADPQYTYAEPFCEGLAVIGYADGKRCMIDTEGNVVLPMVYDHISQCSNGTVVAYAEGQGWSIYNKMSAEDFTEPSNPILSIKRRIIAQKLFDEAEAALTAPPV